MTREGEPSRDIGDRMRADVDAELARLRDRFGDDEVVEARWLGPEHPPKPVYEPFRDRASRWANA